MSYERHASFHRTYLAILGAAAAIAVVGTVFAGLLSTESIAAPTVAPSNVTEPRVTGPTRVGQVLRTTRGEWTGTDADPVRVPVVPVRRSRSGRCVGLQPDLERQQCVVLASAGRRRLPDPLAGRRAQRRRSGHGDVEPDERRHRGQAGEHDRAVDHGDGAGRQHARGQSWPVGRRHADHLLVRLASLQRQGRQLQRDPGCERHELRGARRRHRAGRSACVSSRETTVARRRPSRTRPASSDRTSLPRLRPAGFR